MESQDFYAWRHCPAGKWFFDGELEKEIRALMDVICQGSAAADDVGKTAMTYSNMCGVLDGIHHVRNLDPFGEQIETESDRTPPVDQDGR